MRPNKPLTASKWIALDLMGGCALALLGMSGPVMAAQQAGVAAGVIGNLRVSDGDRPAPQAVKSGMDMLLQDRINSAAASRMQILLLDETVFTIGPDSDLVIDEFVYDPSSQTGRLTANFTKGVLRYVSGKVAAANPAAVTIKTRDATIGVRGTALFVMDDPESGEGAQFIGLLGPGGRNDGGLKVGGLTVTTPHGNTDIFRAGYGTFVSPGQAPGPVIQTPPRLTLLLQTQLTAPVPVSEAPAGEEGQNQSDSGGGASESTPAVADAAEASGSAAAETGMDSVAVAGVLSDLGVVAGGTVKAEEDGAGTNDSLLTARDTTQSPPPPPTTAPPPPPQTTPPPPPPTTTPPPPPTTVPPPPPPPPPPTTTLPPPPPIENVTTVAQNDALGALPFHVAIPYAIEMIWSAIPDIDLHMTGNDPNAVGGRFHVNYAFQGNYLTSPFAQLDEDQTGVGGSEVIGLSTLVAGTPYRTGVFNFGGGSAAVGTTQLADQANVRMRYITNGEISRAANGSTIVNGTVRATVSPSPGGVGNTWVGLEIATDGTATVLNRFGDSVGSDGVAAVFDPPPPPPPPPPPNRTGP